jgi:hypothetical protein
MRNTIVYIAFTFPRVLWVLYAVSWPGSAGALCARMGMHRGYLGSKYCLVDGLGMRMDASLKHDWGYATITALCLYSFPGSRQWHIYTIQNAIPARPHNKTWYLTYMLLPNLIHQRARTACCLHSPWRHLSLRSASCGPWPRPAA